MYGGQLRERVELMSTGFRTNWSGYTKMKTMLYAGADFVIMRGRLDGVDRRSGGGARRGQWSFRKLKLGVGECSFRILRGFEIGEVLRVAGVVGETLARRRRAASERDGAPMSEWWKCNEQVSGCNEGRCLT